MRVRLLLSLALAGLSAAGAFAGEERGAAPFATVGGTTVSLDKAVHAPGDEMTVTVTGADRQWNSPWVGIYKPGAPHNQYGDYVYLKDGEGDQQAKRMNLKAPAEAGSYEMRLYTYSRAEDGSYRISVPFTVDSGGGSSTGGIDPKLVGQWNYEGSNTYIYKFSDDGGFFYFQRMGGSMSIVKGSYTASGGRVYLSALVTDMGAKLKDHSLGYSIESDAEGVYLSIPDFKFLHLDSNEEPFQNRMEFRRGGEDAINSSASESLSPNKATGSPENKSIDRKLLGSWFRTDNDPRGNTRHNNYVFKEDGTFSRFTGSNYTGSSYTGSITEGKYIASDGKLYLSELSYNYSVGSADGPVHHKDLWADMTIEYSIEVVDGRTTLYIPAIFQTPYIGIKDGRAYYQREENGEANAPAQAPGENSGDSEPDESGIAGKWVRQIHIFEQDEDWISRWIEFKSDGTYSFYLDAGTLNSSGETNLSAGLLTEGGNYAVKESAIHCWNRVQSFKSRLDIDASYSDRVLDEAYWPFMLETYENPENNMFNDSHSGFECLSINMHPDSNAFDDYCRNISLEKLDGILRWPSGLPEWLYPSGFTGIVFSSSTTVLNIEKAFKNGDRLVNFQVRMHEGYEDELKQYAAALLENGFSRHTEASYRKDIDVHGTEYQFTVWLGANNWVWRFKTAYIQFDCFRNDG